MANPDQYGEKNSEQNPQHAAEDSFGSSSFGNSDFGSSDLGQSDFGGSSFGAASSFDSSEASGVHHAEGEETLSFGENSVANHASDSDFGASEFGGSDFGSNDFGNNDFGQPVPPAGNFNQGGFNQQFQSQQNQPGQPQQGFGGFPQQGQPQPGQPGQQAFGGYPQQNHGGFNQPAQQGFGPYPQGLQQAQPQKDSFFKSLFDFKFSSFITVKFASVIYIIAMIVGVLWWLGGLLFAVMGGSLGGLAGSLSGSSFGGGMAVMMIFGHLIFGTLGLVLYLIQVRLVLEFFVANIQTTENTKKLVENAEADK
ncbi:hypothetical protein AZH46_04895 [Corynebacterium striatum]|uniref:DUF4282 domain-containing protein n=1 Tax=Corynebacterium striatum TaxID=43770 RepID=UPI000C621D93|nr:DUF4282 domain-containing protein [Corynebacterium striatum]MBD0856248.1 hypothetical protein [Corynebacterium striatum]PIS60024.1 hypothetical protein AZH45_01350 [Corynebacterium striatum]PIS60327.1 hypothetical protein AZH47_08620 [Corynebacterium striatum]PIS67333.1 hypothetical protein AZH46_04895 [Corynebacterium striatum]PXY08532.1 hypothetical protein CKF72_09995 [Corynebacterium striatum]